MEIAGEVRSLVASSSEAGDFLETPAIDQVASDSLPAGQEIGPYAIVDLIGHGGMGSVYCAARASDFQKKVAIKVVKRGMDTEFILERFRQERQILAILDHPKIARLLDGGATSAEGRIGDNLLMTGDPAGALVHDRIMLELWRLLLDQDPKNAFFRAGMAGLRKRRVCLDKDRTACRRHGEPAGQ